MQQLKSLLTFFVVRNWVYRSATVIVISFVLSRIVLYKREAVVNVFDFLCGQQLRSTHLQPLCSFFGVFCSQGPDFKQV